MDEERKEELIQWIIDQGPHCENCGCRLLSFDFINGLMCDGCPGDTVHPFWYIAQYELKDAFIQEFGEEEWEDFIHVEPPDASILDYNDPEDIISCGPMFEGIYEEEDDETPRRYDCCEGCDFDYWNEDFPNCTVGCKPYQEEIAELGDYEIRWYQKWLGSKDNND